MPQGLIVKALAGFYYVLPEGVSPQAKPVECRARGIFKKNKVTPLVGDRVSYTQGETGEGTVNAIGERTSELIRPPIANVEQAMLVFSLMEPVLNLQLLDKFLVHIEYAGLEPIICLTKHDLLQALGSPAQRELARNAIQMYHGIGYEVLITSSKQAEGIQQVRERLNGRISVFAGQSGVGKSSLINAVIPGLQLETNEISIKLGRGKHTTRHVELVALPSGGWVADTPGFSQLDFLEIEAEELSRCFREFEPLAANCRFRGCLHSQEPGCKVRESVVNGHVAESRFAHYTAFLTEIKERKRRY